MLEKSEIAPAGRWDPINVVRVISAMVRLLLFYILFLTFLFVHHT